MVRLREGVSCERVGDSWLVLGDRDGVVHNLTGPAAIVIDCVTTGQPIPPDCDDAAATLVDTGILTAPTGWSRRKVLAAGGAAAAVGMVTLTLPTAAMAASVGPFGTVTATPGSNQATINWTAAASTSYQVVYKRSDTDDSNYVNFFGSVDAGPVVVTGLTNLTSYSFFVRIVGSSPTVESAVVTATPTATLITDLGASWSAASAAGLRSWYSVAYGNGVWVAVAGGASDGTARVMRSVDGVNWFAVSVAPNSWFSVAFGNGMFVAVAGDGGERVMTSTDGLTWFPQFAAGLNEWSSVAYGNGVWVAVAIDGTNRMMRSVDGANWSKTGINGVLENEWRSVAYGNGVWVAVTDSDPPNQVMYSIDDGDNWIGALTLFVNSWFSVAYGNGRFVAVARDGTNRVMYSDDGENWDEVGLVEGVEESGWRSVAYGNGVWVAVAEDGFDRAMYSTNDGVTWTAVDFLPGVHSWYSVAYGNGKFVAVSPDGGSDRVMYSPAPPP